MTKVFTFLIVGNDDAIFASALLELRAKGNFNSQLTKEKQDLRPKQNLVSIYQLASYRLQTEGKKPSSPTSRQHLGASQRERHPRPASRPTLPTQSSLRAAWGLPHKLAQASSPLPELTAPLLVPTYTEVRRPSCSKSVSAGAVMSQNSPTSAVSDAPENWSDNEESGDEGANGSSRKRRRTGQAERPISVSCETCMLCCTRLDFATRLT